jgi:hypothetical protein
MIFCACASVTSDNVVTTATFYSIVAFVTIVAFVMPFVVLLTSSNFMSCIHAKNDCSYFRESWNGHHVICVSPKIVRLLRRTPCACVVTYHYKLGYLRCVGYHGHLVRENPSLYRVYIKSLRNFKLQ